LGLALLFHGRLDHPWEEEPRLTFAEGRRIDFAIVPGPGRVCSMDLVKLGLGELGSIEFHAADQMRLRVMAHRGGQSASHEYAARHLAFAEDVAHIVHSHGAGEVYGRSRRPAMALPATGAHA
jgi:hypothetical protein